MNPQTLLTTSHIIILIGVVLTGLGGFGTYHFGKKVDEVKESDAARLNAQIKALSTQLDSFEDIALKLYPNLSRDEAIEKLKINYEQLQKEIDLHKSTLRNFSSSLKLIFSGKWNDKPYPVQLFSPVNDQYYVEISNANQTIKFYASEVYKFTTLDDKRAEFQSLQEVKAGSYPLGQLTNTLESFSKINIHVPFFLGNSIEEGKINIEKIELVFAINGIECNPLIVEQPHEVKLNKIGNTYWASIGMDIDPITTKELYQINSNKFKPDDNP